jgi:RimJ/RimL family protein N-acetyltransferase
MITLRPHERIDIPLRVKWLNNKNANTFAVDDPNHETTVAEQEAWFDRYESSGNKKFFTICHDGKPIGFVGLSNIDLEKKEASVFIMIGKDEHRGKGVGKEALDLLLSYASKELGLVALTLEVDEENEPAIRLYKSRGFAEIKNVDKDIAMRLEFMV